MKAELPIKRKRKKRRKKKIHERDYQGNSKTKFGEALIPNGGKGGQNDTYGITKFEIKHKAQ